MRINEIPANDYVSRRDMLIEQFHACRRQTLALTEPLSAEDQMLQSMPDASPAKWHLAHTTWFFETFILAQFEVDFACHEPIYQYQFNSYYNGIGEQFPRPRRGMLSRPALQEVVAYRQAVSERMDGLLRTCSDHEFGDIAPLLVLGINHEQQHQELILTDIKHALFQNPMWPAYDGAFAAAYPATTCDWTQIEGGARTVGHAGGTFCFDNETPAHQVLLAPFSICRRQVTNAEWLEFMADGGYEQPLLWLSDGWAWKEQSSLKHPLYWQGGNGEWRQFTLSGMAPLLQQAPVCHLSYYEADAYARWAGARLPTEFEWESATTDCPEMQPTLPAGPARSEFHTTWQWTASAYLPYPGYIPEKGAVGEYNGKFMVNQMVLKGGSCATPGGHSRPTYRNFFPPGAQWQFSGLRLARND